MIADRKKERKVRKRASIMCLFHRGGTQRAEYLKKTQLFGMFGDHCYFFPRILPAEPSMIKIHNNVNIATDVYFCDHDVMNHLFNNIPDVVNKYGKCQYAKYEIEILDNVFVGAHSILMGNIKVGPNAIIAAGAVVTKDVPEGTIVGGNPARVIGSFDEYTAKRINNTK